MTNHFNRLSEAELERLAILIEECGEVAQAACKVIRHGYESKNPKIKDSESNREALERELGDLLHSLERMISAKDLDRTTIEERRLSKPGRILPYLHHQTEESEEA